MKTGILCYVILNGKKYIFHSIFSAYAKDAEGLDLSLQSA